MGVELPNATALEQALFGINNEQDFEKIALDVFRLQFAHNPLYGAFCRHLGRTPEAVTRVDQIPFLPIRFFKTQTVQTGEFAPELIFTSSGTTGETTSRHHVRSLQLYERSFTAGFNRVFGDAADCCILGLLPSYLEREGSSLVYMVDRLIQQSGDARSGFYLYNHVALADTLQQLEREGRRTVLFGVSYALLDFIQTHALRLHHTRVVETGGMKGRRAEMTKDELYHRLREGFGLTDIHSEYGMTELLSQAYAVNGRYHSPPWMRVVLRDETDPLTPATRSGAINVIDLANLYSCSFLATDDRGRLHSDGSFEVLGRLDNSDVRGCSQLVV